MSLNQKDIIIQQKITDLKSRFQDNVIAIYGIGSGFDDNLPSDWIQHDLDLVVFVKDLDVIPIHYDWTNVKYETMQLEEYTISIGYNTVKGMKDDRRFKIQSFANYKWALLDFKHPENAKLLYGQDIRDQLPDPDQFFYDYDDILARGLYHFEKSYQTSDDQKEKEAIQQFTKGIFKFSFYLSVLYDPFYPFTSIPKYIKNLNNHYADHVPPQVFEFIKKAVLYRTTGSFEGQFNKERNNFVFYILNLFRQGKLHRPISYNELIDYLSNPFRNPSGKESPFKNILILVQKIKEKKNS